jgi:transposase
LLAAVEKQVAEAPERYELHDEDETPVETTPYLSKGWHRKGMQPMVPAAGTNRRVTVCGRVEALGRGRVAVICAGQDAACFERYLEAREARHGVTRKAIYLALDTGPCHTSTASPAALAKRAEWLHVIPLAQYSPPLNPKERAWRRLKRDVRSHLAPTLRTFGDAVAVGLRELGGEQVEVVDLVPEWFIEGHRKEPAGRPAGRPKGSQDSYKRAPYRKQDANLPAPT